MDTNYQAPVYVPLKDKFLQAYGVRHTAGSLRIFHVTGKHPNWFVKIGGKVLLDVKAYFDSAKKENK